jgi:signal transduction histidine kinase
MSPRDWPIGRKFLLGSLGISVAGIVLISAFLLVSNYRAMRRDRQAAAQVLVDMIANNAAPALVFDDPAVAKQILAGASADRSTALAAIYDTEGRLYARFPDTAADAQFPPAPAGRRVELHGHFLDAFTPIVSRGRVVGTALLRSDLEPTRQRFNLYVWTVLGGVGAAVAFAFVLAHLLQRWIAEPLRSLSRTAAAIAAGRDYSLRAEKRSRDEVGALVDAFNAMVQDVETSHAKISSHAAQLEKEVAARTAELRELVAELEAFSYTVSHDLRAPLRTISGYADALGDPQSTPAQRAEYLARVQRATQRMDRLITDVLSYAKINKSQLELSPVDLDRVVAEVSDQFRHAAGSPLQVIVEKPLGVVCGHEPALAQVLANLIGNAIKFVPPDRAPRLHIWAESRGPMRRISVRDNGVGIRPEDLSRLFQIFERVHRGGCYEGTGIGLSIVKKATEKMRGTVGVESIYGEGSTFWIELTLPPGAAAGQQR